MPKVEKYRLRAALSQCIAHRGFGFFDGGCLIFAEAALRVFPKGKIITITRGPNRRADHYGLLIEGGMVIDGDGSYETPHLWAQEFSRKENIYGQKVEVVLDRVKSAEIPRDPALSRKISRILSAPPPSPKFPRQSIGQRPPPL